MMNLSTLQTYKPRINSRRPELMAWIFSLSIILFLIAQPQTGFFAIGGVILAVFFIFSALTISIGNWVNRKTELSFNKDEICFYNGIRKTCFQWEDITRMEIYPGRFNDKISLLKEAERLNFDVIGSNETIPPSSPRYGFEEGEKILDIILDRTNLVNQRYEGQGYYYYSD